MFLFYDRPFLYVCNLEENLSFFTLILGSVFCDYVVFYGDVIKEDQLPGYLLSMELKHFHTDLDLRG